MAVRKWNRLFAIVFVLIAVGVVGLRMLDSDSGIGEGGPVEIRLVGVRSAGSKDIYDVSGKKIERIGLPSFSPSVWRDKFQREFIFEVEKGKRINLRNRQRFLAISPASEKSYSLVPYFSAPKVIRYRGKQYVIINCRLSGSYERKLLFWRHEAELNAVDLLLSYYYYGPGTPHSQTVFKDVKLTYPSPRKPVMYRPFIRQMSERLEGDKFSDEKFKSKGYIYYKKFTTRTLSSEKYIKVIDILDNDLLIQRALDKLEAVKFDGSDLSDEDFQRILDTAMKWYNGTHKASGVRLGLMCRQEKFFDMALDLLGNWNEMTWSNDDRFHYPRARSIIENLRRCGDFSLNEERVANILRAVRNTDFPDVRGYLTSYLSSAVRNDNDKAGEALIKLANDERCWIWRHAVRCIDPKKMPVSFYEISHDFQVKKAIADSRYNSKEYPQKVYRKISRLFNIETAERDRQMISDLLLFINQKFDRKEAVEIFVDFMREARKANRLHSRTCLVVCRMISHINYWYGVDLCGLGKKLTAKGVKNSPDNLYELKPYLNEAIRWYESNKNVEPALPKIEVKIVDTKGRGIEGAKFAVYRIDRSDMVARKQRTKIGECFSDKNGKAGFEDIPNGFEFAGVFSAEGFLPREKKLEKNYRGDYYIEKNTVKLAVPTSIRGKVLGEDGAALGGEKFRLLSSDKHLIDPEKRIRIIETDGEGRFEAEGLPVGFHLFCYPEQKNLINTDDDKVDATFTAKWIRAESPEGIDAVVDLSRLSTVEFEFVDGKGQPVKDIDIRFITTIRGSWGSANRLTVFSFRKRNDDDGIYRIRALKGTFLSTEAYNRGLGKQYISGRWGKPGEIRRYKHVFEDKKKTN